MRIAIIAFWAAVAVGSAFKGELIVLAMAIALVIAHLQLAKFEHDAR
jgi:hypothetical protein